MMAKLLCEGSTTSEMYLQTQFIWPRFDSERLNHMFQTHAWIAT